MRLSRSWGDYQEQPCVLILASSLVLVAELILAGGLLWDGLSAAPSLGLSTSQASCWPSFAQVAGEGGVVDLLEVLLDFGPGMLQ